MKKKTYIPKKRKKRKKFLLPSFFVFFILCILTLCVFFVLVYRSSSDFISPLPKGGIWPSLNASKDTQKETLANALAKANILVASIEEKDSNTFLIKLATNEEVLLSKQKSFQTQVSSLQLILSRLTIEGKRFERIDLRFDNPVVTEK